MDGLLLIHKPAGMTSFDVIAKLRKGLHQSKFGHTGTLDPEATGLLLVLAGKSTKILPFLANTDKTYEAKFELGYTTDTEDIWGKKVAQRIVTDFDLANELNKWIGEQTWLVPAASSKKVNGKKLIEYLRQGLEVPKVYQTVNIKQLDYLGPNHFRMTCSSGTYVRSFIRELVKPNLACMSELVRTKVGDFSLDMAQSIEEAIANPKLYNPAGLLGLERIEVADPMPIYQGKPIQLSCDAKTVLLCHQSWPLAVYEQAGGHYRCVRGLW